ncbi:MAG: hypothetical protein FWC41_13005 [Firmicutes bacterium]|nr:hypothetical protein [Bacillota bacterium]
MANDNLFQFPVKKIVKEYDEKHNFKEEPAIVILREWAVPIRVQKPKKDVPKKEWGMPTAFKVREELDVLYIGCNGDVLKNEMHCNEGYTYTKYYVHNFLTDQIFIADNLLAGMGALIGVNVKLDDILDFFCC